MKSGTPELMKFKRLQRRLGCTIAQLVGHLELLWIATAKNAPEGDIGRFSNEDIAIACYWEDDPDLFVHALTECGWLDVSDEWRLLVHDWAQHAPTWVGGNLKRHGRDFRRPGTQATEEPTKEPTKEPAIATSSEQPTTLPSQAKPDLAKPNTLSPTPSEASVLGKTLTTLPGDVAVLWWKWLEVRRYKHGPMSEIQQEAVLMDLMRRGDRMQADLELTIRREGKNILDSTVDYGKPNGPARASPGTGHGSNRLTKGQRISQESKF
jgi:hypothetical protein